MSGLPHCGFCRGATLPNPNPARTAPAANLRPILAATSRLWSKMRAVVSSKFREMPARKAVKASKAPPYSPTLPQRRCNLTVPSRPTGRHAAPGGLPPVRNRPLRASGCDSLVDREPQGIRGFRRCRCDTLVDRCDSLVDEMLFFLLISTASARADIYTEI